MMRKLLSVILCAALLLALAAGCAAGGKPDDRPPDAPSENTDGKEGGETPDAPDGPADPGDPGGETPSPPFTFRAKLSSAYMDEVFGAPMVEAWYNLVDAVLAGEDTFACPDEDTYDWVMGQFPDRYFPVFSVLIEKNYGDGSVVNGVAGFRYKVSQEERAALLADFETLVTELLNETMKPEYTDMEKALSLYRYISSRYTYDSETFEKQDREGYVDYVSSYRFLTGDTGICTECARAYSYLLLQAGVEATTMLAPGHEWSYVRINGNNYHVDPTFAMGEDGSLRYFMMTDDDRQEDFAPESFVICSNYSQEHPHPAYAADDDFFDQIHSGYLEDFDHGTHTMHTYGYNRDQVRVDVDFDYAGF